MCTTDLGFASVTIDGTVWDNSKWNLGMCEARPTDTINHMITTSTIGIGALKVDSGPRFNGITSESFRNWWCSSSFGPARNSRIDTGVPTLRETGSKAGRAVVVNGGSLNVGTRRIREAAGDVGGVQLAEDPAD